MAGGSRHMVPWWVHTQTLPTQRSPRAWTRGSGAGQLGTRICYLCLHSVSLIARFYRLIFHKGCVYPPALKLPPNQDSLVPPDPKAPAGAPESSSLRSRRRPQPSFGGQTTLPAQLHQGRLLQGPRSGGDQTSLGGTRVIPALWQSLTAALSHPTPGTLKLQRRGRQRGGGGGGTLRKGERRLQAS